MSVGKVLRGGAWLSLGLISSSVLNFLYWLLASKFVDPSTIGVVVVALGFVDIFAGTVNLGIHIGTQRFFGQSIGRGDRQALGRYLYSSLAYLAVSSVIVALTLTLIGCLHPTFIGLTRTQLYFMAAMIALGVGSWTPLYNSLFTSKLRTDVIALASVASATLRLILGIPLLYIGLKLLGIMLASILSASVTNIIYLYSTRRILPKTALNVSFGSLKEAIHAGLAYWIPNFMAIAGHWLGVVGLYVLTGSHETGRYYIVFAIAMVICSLPTSVLTLMFPVLSGMEDGRKRATHRATRFSMTIATPLSLILIAYPELPLSLLGSAYEAAANPLRILLLGGLAAPLTLGFTTLIYAYGHYRHVTLIGLAENASRIILYPFLASAFAETGVAIAYVSGFFTTLTITTLMAHQVGYRLPWPEALKTLLPPLSVAVTCLLLQVNWLVGVPLLFLSILLYPKLGLIARSDLAEASTALLSKQTIAKVYPYAKPVIDLLFRE